MAMIIGGLMASAGIWGIPFADDLKDIIEAIYAWANDKDIDLEAELRTAIYDATGSALAAEAINRGALRMTGADMSRRIGMGNILPTDSFLSMFGVETRNGGEALGVSLDLTFGRLKRIAENLKNGQSGLAAAEALPAFAKNPVQAYYWSTEGVKSGGATVILPDDLSDMDIVMKAFGFTPTAVTRKREQEWSVTRANSALTDMTSRYYKKLARASVAGDRTEFARLHQEISDYNEGRAVHDQVRIHRQSLISATRREALGYDARINKGPKKTRAYAGKLREAFPD